MLLLVSFSAINSLLIAAVTQLEVLRRDYCSCKMPLCWLQHSAGANASIKLSNICSEGSTRGLEPGTAAVKSQQHWGVPESETTAQLWGNVDHGQESLSLLRDVLGFVSEALLPLQWVLQRGRQSSGCASQEGQMEQLESFRGDLPMLDTAQALATPQEGDVAP